MFFSGSLSAERRKDAEKQRQVKEIQDRIAVLNEQPPSGPRDEELKRLIHALSVFDKDRADGLIPSQYPARAGNRIVAAYFDPNPAPQRRRRLEDPRAERCWEINQLLRALNIGLIVNDGLEGLRPEVFAEAQRLQGLSEYRKVAVGLELTNELDRLRSELLADRRAKADADFAAIKAEADAANARVRELEAKLTAKVVKLLGEEAELVAAMQECQRVAQRAEALVLREPSLTGRRVACLVGGSQAIATAPGYRLQHLARKATAQPALKVAK